MSNRRPRGKCAAKNDHGEASEQCHGTPHGHLQTGTLPRQTSLSLRTDVSSLAITYPPVQVGIGIAARPVEKWLQRLEVGSESVIKRRAASRRLRCSGPNAMSKKITRSTPNPRQLDDVHRAHVAIALLTIKTVTGLTRARLLGRPFVCPSDWCHDFRGERRPNW